MKQMSPGLGDEFDKSLQVTEDGDGIFDESDVGRDKERLKIKVQDSTLGVELSW
jgi:hypothetical protein